MFMCIVQEWWCWWPGGGRGNNGSGGGGGGGGGGGERKVTCGGVSHDRTCFRQSQWYGVVSRWSSEIDPVK